MYGYTVKYSIDVIDEFCNNPEKYKDCLKGAINDARTHYQFGNVSKAWYESVVRILSEYI